MKPKILFERKTRDGYQPWLVERTEDGKVHAIGPDGTALYVNDEGIWVDHEVPSAEYEDCVVLERASMPMDWFVKALRANGFKVTPPKGADYGGLDGSWGDGDDQQTAAKRKADAAAYLQSLESLPKPKRVRDAAKKKGKKKQ